MKTWNDALGELGDVPRRPGRWGMVLSCLMLDLWAIAIGNGQGFDGPAWGALAFFTASWGRPLVLLLITSLSAGFVASMLFGWLWVRLGISIVFLWWWTTLIATSMISGLYLNPIFGACALGLFGALNATAQLWKHIFRRHFEDGADAISAPGR